MTVPGLTSCTTKYKVTRDAKGNVINNRNTKELYDTAKKNLSGAQRAG